MPLGKLNPTTDPRLSTRTVSFGIIALIVLVVVAAVGGLWTVHTQSRLALEDEMSLRLSLLATEVASAVPADSLLGWSLEDDSIRLVELSASTVTALDSLIEAHGLNYVVVYSPELEVLIDTSMLREIGAPELFFVDSLAVSSAMSGVTSATAIQEVADDEYLMAAYSGIGDSELGWQGVVAVHAAPGFFGTLSRLRGTMIAISAGVSLVLVLAASLAIVYARRLERTRKALARSETLSAMGRMSAGIAHEIRNPLGIIKNTAQLLQRELSDKGLETDLADYIPEEVDRLSQILTGYLEFAQDKPMARETVELTALVKRTLKLLEPDLVQQGIEWEFTLATDGPIEAFVDARQLQQLLLNLLLNAVRAMEGGGRLDVYLESEPDGARIAIADDGTGMDPSEVEGYFEPFVTTHAQGSGLGLSVVRRIIDEHGGRIDVQTAKGEGSTFTVFLPRTGGPNS